MTELIKKPWNYILHQDDISEEYKLSISCGTVGLYDVEMTLTIRQVKEFQEKGEVYIDTLAQSIRDNPKKII